MNLEKPHAKPPLCASCVALRLMHPGRHMSHLNRICLKCLKAVEVRAVHSLNSNFCRDPSLTARTFPAPTTQASIKVGTRDASIHT